MRQAQRKLKDRIENAKTPKEKLWAKFELGKLYHDEERYKQAIQSYREIQKDRNNPVPKSELLSALAVSYDLLGDEDTSASLYKEVLSVNRGVIEDRFLVADAALESGIINYHKNNLEEALKYFKTSQKLQSSFDDEANSFLYAHLGR